MAPDILPPGRALATGVPGYNPPVMWPWASKSCPLDPTTRAWVDRRWRWLLDEFGDRALLDYPHVLPTPGFFPDRYDGSDTAGTALGRRVCGYMHVPEDRVDFEFFSESNTLYLVNERGRGIGIAVGTFTSADRFIIRVERAKLREPMALVGTLAHELSHARLLGEKRIDRDCFDHELATDLNVVFHGMGIFIANDPGYSDGHIRNWPGTEQPAPTYMTAGMLGYALALRCCQRMESLPSWRKHLLPSVRAEFKQSYRFLTQ